MTSAYEVLGVASSAGEATIEAAFRKAAKEWHPDLNGGDTSGEERLKHLIAARSSIMRRRKKAKRQLIVRHAKKGWHIIAAGTLAAISASVIALCVCYRPASPVGSFETTVLSGNKAAWTTSVQDLGQPQLRSKPAN
jgi:hypothetical protein